MKVFNSFENSFTDWKRFSRNRSSNEILKRLPQRNWISSQRLRCVKLVLNLMEANSLDLIQPSKCLKRLNTSSDLKPVNRDDGFLGVDLVTSASLKIFSLEVFTGKFFDLSQTFHLARISKSLWRGNFCLDEIRGNQFDSSSMKS